MNTPSMPWNDIFCTVLPVVREQCHVIICPHEERRGTTVKTKIERSVKKNFNVKNSIENSTQ